MADYQMYTKTQLGKLAGVSKEAVRQWAINNQIRQDSKYRLYAGDPAVIEYIRKNKLKNKIAVMPKNKPYKRVPRIAPKPDGRAAATISRHESLLESKSSDDALLESKSSGDTNDVAPEDKLTPREERLLRNQELKLVAELRKTEASATNMELRNLVARGNLGDIKFLSSLFYQQLNYAIRQFLILPTSTMDDIIALAMEKGESARVDCVNLQNERINQIGEITVKGWDKNIKIAEAELSKLTGGGEKDG